MPVGVGTFKALLSLYDAGAVLECDCDGVSLRGRNSIAKYWEARLESRREGAFSLDHVALTRHGVQVDYQSYEGKPVRLYFRFGGCTKIIYTHCGPMARGWRKIGVH
ncbi:hypothetical protein ACVWWG_000406 [Bradyrhizobium sp. LB7.2]